MVNGIAGLPSENGLNTVQIDEETQKSQWIDDNPQLAEKLYELEDHALLYGQIGIIGLDNIALADSFMKLFGEKFDLDTIDCALMAKGNYGQYAKNQKRYQLGTSNAKATKAWQDLFHKSANGGYDNTKSALEMLLISAQNIATVEELKSIVDEFIEECEAENRFDIRYYYVKYQSFRPGSYGKYWWEDYANKPYEVFVMRTKSYLSQNSYQPFLYEVDNDVSKDDYGNRIILGDKYLCCVNDGYVMRSISDDTELERLYINQNAEGIDVEDRIVKFREYYKGLTQNSTS
jgi:hypothetical protein